MCVAISPLVLLLVDVSRPFIFRYAARNLNVSPHSPLFMCQYKNVKADVCPPVFTPLVAHSLVHSVPRRDLERGQL